MASPVQIIGGSFVDLEGGALANGSLILQLNEDSTANGNTGVGAGIEITIPLDGSGNVSGTRTLWPNDELVPTDTYYLVTAYSSTGQLVWGPNAQRILSSPSPYNISSWTPGIV